MIRIRDAAKKQQETEFLLEDHLRRMSGKDDFSLSY